MQIFRCDHCGSFIFFENSQCTRCGHTLAFLPDRLRMAALQADGDTWHPAKPHKKDRARYRLCANYQAHDVCNWTVAADDPNPLCLSCRLTQVIPDLQPPGHLQAWYRMEIAKRRLLYTLIGLGLPIQAREDDPQHGLAFEFLADPPPGEGDGKPVLTGHADGLITINLAEADDAERERRRLRLHEPYRTLLGHFRHEIGHYYWDQLIAGSPRLDAFRERFGDEREDYAAALQRHYEQPAADWAQQYISAYASSHPWEDWAETWAHYLHMIDTLETASACGLSLRSEPARAEFEAPQPQHEPFDDIIERWFPLTFALNNLNRGLGQADAYPFVLPQAAIDKLRFVHETIVAARPQT